MPPGHAAGHRALLRDGDGRARHRHAQRQRHGRARAGRPRARSWSSARRTRQIATYDGHHIAVYITNFSGPHARLEGARAHQRGVEPSTSTASRTSWTPRRASCSSPSSTRCAAPRIRCSCGPLVNRNPTQRQATYQRGPRRVRPRHELLGGGCAGARPLAARPHEPPGRPSCSRCLHARRSPEGPTRDDPGAFVRVLVSPVRSTAPGSCLKGIHRVGLAP